MKDDLKIVKVALASDHAGYQLKEEIRSHLEGKGYFIQDFGTFSSQSVDYPDYAIKAARAVAAGEVDYAILACGTGIGMSITANKIEGVRAAQCQDCFTAKAARQHNNANVLTMGARVIGPGLALLVVDNFLETPFQGGRHQRRLDKICQLEKV